MISTYLVGARPILTGPNSLTRCAYKNGSATFHLVALSQPITPLKTLTGTSLVGLSGLAWVQLPIILLAHPRTRLAWEDGQCVNWLVSLANTYI